MYIESVPNRNSPPAILLRESYRDGGKIRKRTIANLSQLADRDRRRPAHAAQGRNGRRRPVRRRIVVRARLAARACGGRTWHAARHWSRSPARACRQSLPRPRHRDDRGAADRAGLQARHRQGMLDPAHRGFQPRRGARSGAGRRGRALRRARLAAGSASRRSRRRSPASICGTACWCSTTCRRAMWRGAAANWRRRGYNRDGKKGKLQIVYGLLCAPDGCPVAIEVFEGNTADPRTLAAQIDKVKKRFALEHVVLVGDRGMITQARIDAEDRPRPGSTGSRRCGRRRSGSLRTAEPCRCRCSTTATWRPSRRPTYPGERLIVCRNPDLARERARKREDLLAATEKDLAVIAAAVRRAAQAAARRGCDRAQGRRRASTGTRWPSTSTSSSARRTSRSIAGRRIRLRHRLQAYRAVSTVGSRTGAPV